MRRPSSTAQNDRLLLPRFTLDLSVPIDVYSEWIDACDAVAKENADDALPAHTTYRGTARASRDDTAGGGDAGYSGEGIVDDDVDGEADYDEE